MPLNIGDNWIAHLARAVIFGTPREMTRGDVDEVVAKFASAAILASRTGFQGVEVHAGRKHHPKTQSIVLYKAI